jgi:hypothetical protein
VGESREIEKIPRRLGAFFSSKSFVSGYSRRLPVSVFPPQIAGECASGKEVLLALGALAMHHAGLEAAFFQPAEDLVLGEADVRFDPHIRV